MLLSQQQNNPDRLLIKQTNPFDTLAEKNSEIIRLKKVIAGYENKYNGQYFSENKIRKDYDVLLKEN